MVNNVDLFGNEVDNVDKMIMAMGVLLPHVSKVPGVKNTLKSMIGYLKKGGVPAKNALLKIFKKGEGAIVKLFADSEKGASHGLNIFEDLGGEFLENAGEIVEDVVSGDWNNLFKTKKMKPADIVGLEKNGSSKILNKLKEDMGIIGDYEVGITTKGDKDGISFSRPGTVKSDEIRVMPGNPKNPNQNDPYVSIQKGGQRRDINGKVVNRDSKEAHIDMNDFRVPDWF